MVRATLLSLILGFAALAAPCVQAVEAEAVKIAGQWLVVGVISGTDKDGKDIGVAVLKNVATKRTFTLSIGDTLPNEFGFTLKAIEARKVVITDRKKDVILSFAEGSPASGEDEGAPSRTARFIDNYYRGLSDAPIEVFKNERAEADAEGEGQGLRLPLRRFGTMKEDAARSRFDLYRTDSAYEDGAADAAENDGGDEGRSSFVVNYDNFQDDDEPGDGPTELPMDAAEITD